jgi:hypothetical protein
LSPKEKKKKKKIVSTNAGEKPGITKDGTRTGGH